ncbi:MAG: helix-turn-helix domain-containing protein [Clostridia bacterium]|nr:helix-turn-helix domain-containing protein [Clostridia bacterium]
MFGDILKKLRIEKDLSQEELATIINVSKSTIGMYEQGNRIPKADATLRKLAEFFNVSIDYLMGFSDNKYPSPGITEDYVTFPVIGDIAAGYDNVAIENWEGEKIDVPLSYLKGRNASDFFVLRVKGDSMYPLYHEDDRVLILKQTTLNYSGQIGAILYDDDCSTLKKVEYVQGEDWMRLVPINPNYTIKTISGPDLEKCRVIGIPKMLIREINER